MSERAAIVSQTPQDVKNIVVFVLIHHVKIPQSSVGQKCTSTVAGLCMVPCTTGSHNVPDVQRRINEGNVSTVDTCSSASRFSLLNKTDRSYSYSSVVRPLLEHAKTTVFRLKADSQLYAPLSVSIISCYSHSTYHSK